MLLRFLRTNGTQIIVLIPLIGILLWLGPLLKSSSATLLSDHLQLPLYGALGILTGSVEYLQEILAFALVLVVAFLLVRLNTHFIIINNRTYLPALIYILIVSGIPEIQKLNPALLTTFIILFIIEIVLNSYRYESLFYGFFVAAFLLGVGSLIYPFFVYFFVTLWAGIILLRQFNWREWMFTILGFGVPFLFNFSYNYVVLDQPGALIERYVAFYQHSFDFKEFSPQVFVFFGILAFIMLLSSQFLLQAYSARKILSRRAFSLLFWLFLNVIGLFFLLEQASVELIYIAAIPLSFLFSNYWTYVKSVFWGNLILVIFIGSVFYNHIIYYFFP